MLFNLISKKEWLVIVTGFILRIINLNLPIVGVHSWRQADTSAMARHFYQNNTPIWLPQIDWSGASNGFVESEFPLFPYLVGQVYKIVGINEWIGRGFAAIFSTITIYFIIKIGEYFLSKESAFWGGLFFAICPISVYYGRTFQAESLLMLLASISILMMIYFKSEKGNWSIVISWLTFTLCCMIKFLPLAWLGITLLAIYIGPTDFKKNITDASIRKNFLNHKNHIFLFLLFTLIFTGGWFFHAFHLGKASGISFGFWGASSDRSSLRLLFDMNLWLNLLLRIVLKNLAIIGLPLLIIGIHRSINTYGSRVLLVGLFGIFICTVFALRASTTHEYYQLPLQLFFCPLVGHGLVAFNSMNNLSLNSNILLTSTVSLCLAISLVVLSIDYWAIEQRQAVIWMPLARRIRKEIPKHTKIVSVTGGDPTLLNLARRQGWLTHLGGINNSQLQEWSDQGATHIAGSLNWRETHIAIYNDDYKRDMKDFLCRNIPEESCIISSNNTYLLPIKSIIQ